MCFFLYLPRVSLGQYFQKAVVSSGVFRKKYVKGNDKIGELSIEGGIQAGADPDILNRGGA